VGHAGTGFCHSSVGEVSPVFRGRGERDHFLQPGVWVRRRGCFPLFSVLWLTRSVVIRL